MTNNIGIGGAVTFWRLAEDTDRNGLMDGLTGLGLNKLCPEPRTDWACLKGALEDCFPSREGWKVFPKKRGNAFEVVQITYRDEGEDNDYTKFLDVSINEHRQVSLRPWASGTVDRILECFNKQLGILRPSQVTKMLVAHAGSLSATALRPSGGIYWLPPDRINDFRAVGEVVVRCAARGTSVVHYIRHQMDGDAMRAVRDAIVQEVKGESERIHREIVSGELGEKALEHRAQEIESLRQKIVVYEGLLNTGLGDLREGLDLAEQGVAAAAIMGAGAGA